MFAYCGNDPVNAVDHTGTKIRYLTIDGEWDSEDGLSCIFFPSNDFGTTSGSESWSYSSYVSDFGTTNSSTSSYSGSYPDPYYYSYSTNSPEYAATNGTPYEIGLAGENLAGIVQDAKIPIEINGRIRIPDELTPTVLKEVKNVKYISNTLQLRDFSDYAGDMLIKELWVRPTTKIAKTIIQAGWIIRFLW